MMLLALLIAWSIYTVLTALRIGLALRFLRRDRQASDIEATLEDEAAVTVLQPILSGDPTLERNLDENLRHHPTTHFLWLVDEDDAKGREIAARLSQRHADRFGALQIHLVPPPPQGKNPKVFKLVLGLEEAGPLVAVLDDDTVLPKGALGRACRALEKGDLVTGLPSYRSEGSLWSQLLAAFVNGNALLTYLPILSFRRPVTINGMFYLTRRRVLEEVGGFRAIEDKLCDDYELAKLYRAAGLRIVQTTIIHPISTTVQGAFDYVRILRRWMVFANHLFLDAIDPLMIVLVVLPALLPGAMMLLSVGLGPLAVVATLLGLLGKAVFVGWMRGSFAGGSEPVSSRPLSGLALEVLADFLQPLHAVSALVRPRRIRWRSRSIVTKGGGIRYR